jgi:signal recognition particle subunit SRP72
LSLPKTDQLFDFQKTISYQNELALDLLASKFSAVANSTERILLVRSSATTSVGVNELSTANAAAHAKNELDVKDMLPLLEKRPNDVGLTLTIVHIYLLQRNHGAAIRVLEAFFKRMEDTINESNKEARFAPGLVSILVALYSKPTTRKSHIRIELAKAASYWRHKLKRPRGLLHAAGVSLLQSSKPEDHEAAGEIFKDLLEKDPKDQLAVAGLVAAYATSDLSKVESQLNQLPQVNRLTAGVDVDALENAGVPQAASTSTILSRKRVGENSDTTTKKRNRKSRLPKEYDPKKAPGPERWLPLRDRSTYKPKGKKGKLKVAGLTQGGISEKGGDGLNASSEVIVKPASTVVGSSAKQKKKKPKK